jgi:hypothetical protein
MIDNFALALSHGLLMLAAWRLLFRPDLDDENAPEPPPSAQGGGRIADALKKVRKGA